jgi:hypothetical protein
MFNYQFDYQFVTRLASCRRRASADILYGPRAILQQLRSLTAEKPTSAVGHQEPFAGKTCRAASHCKRAYVTRRELPPNMWIRYSAWSLTSVGLLK